MLRDVGLGLLTAARALILQVLEEHPDGLTNIEVGRRTGLHVEVPKQRGYVQWTLLEDLVQQGLVERVGDSGKAYYRRTRTERRSATP